MKKFKNSFFITSSFMLLCTVFSKESFSDDKFKAKSSGSITCKNVSSIEEAQSCVSDLIKNSRNLDSVYAFIQYHGTQGQSGSQWKHLGEMHTCLEDAKLRGSFFPQNKADFKNVFVSANVKNCKENESHGSYNCFVKVTGNTCLAGKVDGATGKFKGGTVGNHDIIFSVDQNSGELRTVFPSNEE